MHSKWLDSKILDLKALYWLYLVICHATLFLYSRLDIYLMQRILKNDPPPTRHHYVFHLSVQLSACLDSWGTGQWKLCVFLVGSFLLHWGHSLSVGLSEDVRMLLFWFCFSLSFHSWFYLTSSESVKSSLWKHETPRTAFSAVPLTKRCGCGKIWLSCQSSARSWHLTMLPGPSRVTCVRGPCSPLGRQCH